MAEFDRLKMKETDTIDAFVGKLSEISSKSASLGETIEETKIVKKFLKSLPRKRYIHIIAALEQVLDLKTTSFEDIVGRLKAYEERIGEEEEEQEEHDKLMYAKSDDSYGGGRGRGRGGRFGGRGRGRGRSGNAPYRQERDKEREAMITCFRCDKQGHYASNCPDRLLKLQEMMITCFRCDKQGHYASSCPERLLKIQEAVEKKDTDTQETDILMMHEVVYLNERNVKPSLFETNLDTKNVWYLDNGASNHMCGNRDFSPRLIRV